MVEIGFRTHRCEHLWVRIPPGTVSFFDFPPSAPRLGNQRPWPYRAVPLIEKRRGLSPGGRFPPSFIHQVIIMTGLNKLQLYVPQPFLGESRKVHLPPELQESQKTVHKVDGGPSLPLHLYLVSSPPNT